MNFNFIPSVYAHEAYVLDNTQLEVLRQNVTYDSWTGVFTSGYFVYFISWIVFLLLAYFLFSKSKKYWEKLLFSWQEPWTLRIFDSLPLLTVSLMLIIGGIGGMVFGPELKVDMSLYRVASIALGIWGLFGGFWRVEKLKYLGILGMVFYLLTFERFGLYVFSYFQFLAVFAALIWPKYKMRLWSLGLGVALVYTAIDVKFLHQDLTIAAFYKANLDKLIPLSANFFASSAGFTELFLGIMFLVGKYSKLTSIIFAGFAVMALFLFKESLWPHLPLFGLCLGMIFFEKRLK